MRRSLLFGGLLATFLAGCAAVPPGDTPVAVTRGPLPTTTTTPMDDALSCLSKHVPRNLDMRLAVHSIPDRTGVNDYDGPGSYVTQGAELMMISAFAKTGVRQVNRTATSIAEWELTQAMEKRLGEGSKVMVGDTPVGFRPVQIGYYLGSTHTVYGGITELDFDILSGGFEGQVAGVGGKARGYYISVGLDVVVAESKSTEIVLAKSYRKQIWGQELEANLFRFWDIGNGGDDIGDFGTELFDLRLGQQKNEPIHQSVRWVVEQAAFEMVRDLAGVGTSCQQLIPELSRSEPSDVALASPRNRQLAVLPAAAPAEPRELASMPDAVPEPARPEIPPQEVKAVKNAEPLSGQITAGRRAVRLPNGKILVPQDR